MIKYRFTRLNSQRRYTAMGRHRAALTIAILSVAVLSFVPAHTRNPPASEDAVTMPELIRDSYIPPEYPEKARKAGLEGRVVLEVLVGEDGKVTEISVKEDSTSHPDLAASAEQAVRHWRFKPATRNAVPFEMRVEIPFEFKLEDVPETPSQKAGSLPPAQPGPPKPPPLPGRDLPPPPSKSVSALMQRQAAEYEADGEKQVVQPSLVAESYVLPAYPEPERKAGSGGRVLVKAVIDPEGTAVDVEVVEGVEGHPEFAQSAVEAVAKWRFKPGTIDGKPARMTVTIPVEFKLGEK